MAKNFRKALSIMMVLCVLIGVLPLQALAAENTEITTEITTEDGLTTTVTTTTTTTTDENGDSTVVIEVVESNTTGTNSEGFLVNREETSTTTTTTNADGSAREEFVVDGKETQKEVNTPTGTVDVPMTDKDDPSTDTVDNENSIVSGDPTGTVKPPVGDTPEGEDDKSYDYTTETVEQQGKVTVTTTDITVEAKAEGENTDLDYIVSVTNPSATNELIIFAYKGVMTELPAEGETIEGVEGYDYMYLGSGNTSKFWTAYLYRSPSPENPDEKPVYTDANGNNYYLRRQLNSNQYKQNTFDEIYLDGQKVEVEGGVLTTWDVPQHHVLVDSATGKVITTYCADINTATERGFGYNIENLEDADYYDDEQAAMIRTIAANGYWGTADGEVGSLSAMKEMMRTALDENGNRVFTDAEVALLSDGVALTATQAAIWSFSNAMSDIEFLNVHYTKDGTTYNGKDYVVKSNWGSTAIHGDPDNENRNAKESSIALLFKLYTHLVNMAPTDIENKTTADTVINKQNFLEDVSLTVLEKAEDHANNQDEDDTNDAYVTDLTFALVVEPSTENGDDLVVKVITSTGEVLATGRIAGEAQDGETVLTADANGNYTFSGITLVEGEQNIHISLSGVQNLKEGVYLYSSEIKEEDVSSQTLVGLASGDRSVDVSMSLKFDLDVDDEVIVRERVWHDEADPEITPPDPEGEGETPPPTNYRYEYPENDPEEIPEEPVPLTAPPKTGDISVLWILLIMAAGFGIVALNIFGKKRNSSI